VLILGNRPADVNCKGMIETVGRLHPLIVHLPLGIWILLGIIMILPAARRVEMEAAIRLGIRIATISAALAAITGYLLSQSGDYDPDTVNIHQWLGIATAAIGLAAWLLPAWRRILTLSTCAIMTLAGHYGGVLTHGEGYLFPSSEEKETAALTVTDTLNTDSIAQQPTADSNKVAVTFRHPFQDEIKPILAAKCESCHSAKKRKGRLRLDTEDFIRQGGKNGQILKPGDAAGSTLFTHLVLPMDDEMHMPPKGKPQPTAHQIQLIRNWIAAGAPFGPVQVTESKTPSAGIIEPTSQTQVSGPSAPEMSDIPATTVATETMIEEDPKLKDNTAELNKLGLSATIEGSGISLNFVNLTEVSPEVLTSIETKRQHIISLQLRGMQQTDALLSRLPDMPALRILNLSRSDLTNTGIRSLSKFPNIQKLLLYETAITDESVAAMAPLSKLTELNTWRTGITDSAIRNLKRDRPGLMIETGKLTLKKPDSTQRNKP
jgi:hypothetical protein